MQGLGRLGNNRHGAAGDADQSPVVVGDPDLPDLGPAAEGDRSAAVEDSDGLAGAVVDRHPCDQVVLPDLDELDAEMADQAPAGPDAGSTRRD